MSNDLDELEQIAEQLRYGTPRTNGRGDKHGRIAPTWRPLFYRHQIRRMQQASATMKKRREARTAND